MIFHECLPRRENVAGKTYETHVHAFFTNNDDKTHRRVTASPIGFDRLSIYAWSCVVAFDHFFNRVSTRSRRRSCRHADRPTVSRVRRPRRRRRVSDSVARLFRSLSRVRHGTGGPSHDEEPRDDVRERSRSKRTRRLCVVRLKNPTRKRRKRRATSFLFPRPAASLGTSWFFDAPTTVRFENQTRRNGTTCHDVIAFWPVDDEKSSDNYYYALRETWQTLPRRVPVRCRGSTRARRRPFWRGRERLSVVSSAAVRFSRSLASVGKLVAERRAAKLCVGRSSVKTEAKTASVRRRSCSSARVQDGQSDVYARAARTAYITFILLLWPPHTPSLSENHRHGRPWRACGRTRRSKRYRTSSGPDSCVREVFWFTFSAGFAPSRESLRERLNDYHGRQSWCITGLWSYFYVLWLQQ